MYNADLNVLAPPGLDWGIKISKAKEFKLEPYGNDIFELIIIVSSPPTFYILRADRGLLGSLLREYQQV